METEPSGKGLIPSSSGEKIIFCSDLAGKKNDCRVIFSNLEDSCEQTDGVK